MQRRTEDGAAGNAHGAKTRYAVPVHLDGTGKLGIAELNVVEPL
jgi:hypothetical protein